MTRSLQRGGAPPSAGQRPRRTFDDTNCGHGLAILELLAHQVELHADGQPIPSVKSMLFPTTVDLTHHEVATEDVVHDQGRDLTATPRRAATRRENSAMVS